MPREMESLRVVIAGASSLLGAELRERLNESRWAAADLQLVDEEYAAGTLTEAAGEARVIQPLESDSFEKARLVFFTGSPDFTAANLDAARRAGASVIDLSGGALGVPGVRVWFSHQHAPDPGTSVYEVPSAPGTIAARLLDALGRAGLCRLATVFFRPVSEAGRPGIEELEGQTTQLLSFRSVGQPIFDTQVAFNLLDRYGAASGESLAKVRERIRREAAAAVGSDLIKPSIQVLHAPVFYGYTFVALAELNSPKTKEEIGEISKIAGFVLGKDGETPLGNLTASEDDAIHLAPPEADTAQPVTWWFWGAADNIALPVANAVKLAEKLL